MAPPPSPTTTTARTHTPRERPQRRRQRSARERLPIRHERRHVRSDRLGERVDVRAVHQPRQLRLRATRTRTPHACTRRRRFRARALRRLKAMARSPTPPRLAGLDASYSFRRFCLEQLGLTWQAELLKLSFSRQPVQMPGKARTPLSRELLCGRRQPSRPRRHRVCRNESGAKRRTGYIYTHAHCAYIVQWPPNAGAKWIALRCGA
eukprot:3547863-Pleurochrysis_carterae.AAC.1